MNVCRARACFLVTQYCIDSAIGKMAHVAPLQPLLRGMRKPMDPRPHPSTASQTPPRNQILVGSWKPLRHFWTWPEMPPSSPPRTLIPSPRSLGDMGRGVPSWWVRLYKIYRGVGRKRLALSDPAGGFLLRGSGLLPRQPIKPFRPEWGWGFRENLGSLAHPRGQSANVTGWDCQRTRKFVT